MNKYIQEFKQLKPYDPVQFITAAIKNKGYDFITTAGHGYLIVPKTNKNAEVAKNIIEYGYEGALAYYLEEDCEAPEFLNKIK